MAGTVATGGTKTVPTQVVKTGGVPLTGVVAVAAGAAHSLALTSDGNVWAFGLGSSGQLGQGSTGSSNVAIQVTAVSGIVAIAAGDNHSVALKSDGWLYTWGLGTSG
jgi:alpha-tubulin suppressor-like RCC1 family protein